MQAIPHPSPPARGSNARLLLSGYPVFDALCLPQPGRVLLLDIGTREADALVHALLARTVQAGHDVLIADGACWANFFEMMPEADRIGLPRHDFLAGIRNARGFTLHQYVSILERYRSRARSPELHVGLALAAMFPVMFLDEDVDQDEAEILMEDSLAGLRALAREQDIHVLVTNSSLLPRVPHRLRGILDAGTDARVAFLPGPDDMLRIEHEGRVFLAPSPASRQQRLTDYGAEADAATGPAGRYVLPMPHALRYVPSRAGERRFLAEAEG